MDPDIAPGFQDHSAVTRRSRCGDRQRRQLRASSRRKPAGHRLPSTQRRKVPTWGRKLRNLQTPLVKAAYDAASPTDDRPMMIAAGVVDDLVSLIIDQEHVAPGDNRRRDVVDRGARGGGIAWRCCR